MLAFNTVFFYISCVYLHCVGLNAYDSETITVRHFVNIICIDCSDQKRSFVSLTSIIVTSIHILIIYIFTKQLFFFSIITNQFLHCLACCKVYISHDRQRLSEPSLIQKCHRSRTVNKPSGKLHDAGVLPTPEVC